MAADDLNRLHATGADRRATAGDVPDRVRRRYLTDDRSGPGVGFYVDAQVSVPAFRDHGRRLSTSRNDPNVIRDLVHIAAHRGWTKISVQGQTGFRREAWLAARLEGLDVRGYRPTPRDLQDLDRRAANRSPSIDVAARSPIASSRSPSQMDAQTRRRVVEAVVRERVVEPAIQERILAAVRGRLADWLETSAPGRSKDNVGLSRRGRER